MLARSSQFVACALLAVRTAFAIPTIEIKGSKFFTSDGDQFYIKGQLQCPKWGLKNQQEEEEY